MTAVGLIVLATVCIAFGAVGVAIGIGLVIGIAALLYPRRRRTLSELGRLPAPPRGR
ncbi:MAG: hypothetical protein ACRDYE_16755 [Acidimicrobiales bacterium]